MLQAEANSRLRHSTRDRISYGSALIPALSRRRATPRIRVRWATWPTLRTRQASADPGRLSRGQPLIRILVSVW